MSRRGVYRGGHSRRGGMVAGQSMLPEAQNMYCSAVQSPYGSEFYPDNSYYVPGAPPDISHVCTLHGDYGETLT